MRPRRPGGVDELRCSGQPAGVPSNWLLCPFLTEDSLSLSFRADTILRDGHWRIEKQRRCMTGSDLQHLLSSKSTTAITLQMKGRATALS